MPTCRLCTSRSATLSGVWAKTVAQKKTETGRMKQKVTTDAKNRHSRFKQPTSVSFCSLPNGSQPVRLFLQRPDCGVVFIGGVMENDSLGLRRRKTDFDPRIWFLRIHDHGLIWLHIHDLVIDLFYGFQGKFLVFSHVELPTSAPSVDESGH
jgi:hypothetical protein